MPSKEEINSVLSSIEIATIKANIEPTEQQYESLKNKLKVFEFGRSTDKGSTFQYLRRDLGLFFDLFPSSLVAQQRIFLNKFDKLPLYYSNDWKNLYKELKGLILQQIDTTSPHEPLKKDFWNSALKKYQEFLRYYHIDL